MARQSIMQKYKKQYTYKYINKDNNKTYAISSIVAT